MNNKLISGLLFQIVQFFALALWVLASVVGNLTISATGLKVFALAVILIGLNILSLILIVMGMKEKNES